MKTQLKGLKSMIDLKSITASAISSAVESVDYETVYSLLEFPPDEKLGDVSLPCFKLSKIMRKAPPVIANEIYSVISTENSAFDKVICGFAFG